MTGSSIDLVALDVYSRWYDLRIDDDDAEVGRSKFGCFKRVASERMGMEKKDLCNFTSKLGQAHLFYITPITILLPKLYSFPSWLLIQVQTFSLYALFMHCPMGALRGRVDLLEK